MKPIPSCFSPVERGVVQDIIKAMAPLSAANRAKVMGKFDVSMALGQLDAIQNAKYLPDEAKRELAKPLIDEAIKECGSLTADIAHLEHQKELCARQLECLSDLEAWSQKPPILAIERNDCSRLHKLKEAALKGNLIDGTKKGGEIIAPSQSALDKASNTFVVRHDWARAFEHSADWRSGEFKLPYDLCCFEFRLDGRTVILWAMNTENVADCEGPMSFTAFVECGDCWYSPPGTPVDDFESYLWDQVRAICISLDADIAISTIERAPLALNDKRQKAGKLPLSDFHIVDLAKRHRIANPSGAAGEGTKKRLHFRRGHWRHFETSKTWVKWCLVGNPDLGFISKEYRL